MKNILLIFALFVLSCTPYKEKTSKFDVLSKEVKEQIELEVRQRVDDYFEDVQSKDIKGMLSFWSNSEDFIHAGDGSIFGNYDKWSNWLLDRYNKGTVEKWLYWKNSDIHVIVLSKDAAAYTIITRTTFLRFNSCQNWNGLLGLSGI